MDLRHLHYFVTIADGLSFTRAAERLNIAQPSLTLQMGKLEQEIGTRLFSRDGRGIRLTDAGRVFLDRARQIISLAADSVGAAQRAARGETGTLVIGHNTPAEFRIFPAVIPEIKRLWPDVHLEFHNLRVTQQIDGLKRGDLQLGFLWLPIAREGFDIVELTHEPLAAVLPHNHPLAAAKRVSIKDLATENLILFSRSLDPGSSHEIERLFERGGVTMNVTHEMETVLSTLNFVAMGCGCSILPDYTRNIMASGVVYRPLVPNITKRLAMIKRTDAGPIASAAFALIRDAMFESNDGPPVVLSQT